MTQENFPQNNNEILESSIEQKKLESVIARFNAENQNTSKMENFFSIESIGEAGFIIKNSENYPKEGGDWFLSDLDDTMIATTTAKDERLSLYKEVASEDLSGTDEKIIGELMEFTDQFSRWAEPGKEKINYHPTAHLQALEWATQELKNSTDKASAFENIKSRLSQIKTELNQEHIPIAEDPFYFNERGKFVNRKKESGWNSKIGEAFFKTMITPKEYGETIEAIDGISKESQTKENLNIGVFTYGDPTYQLTKTLEFMKRNPDFPINQIWLAKVSKGEFLRTILSPENLEKLGIGPLDKEGHAVVMLDDSPKELSEINNSRDEILEKSGAIFKSVLSRRPGTKEASTDWEGSNFSELNFINSKILPSEVIRTIQINRYLALREKLGVDNEKTKNAANLLNKIGVNLNNLELINGK